MPLYYAAFRFSTPILLANTCNYVLSHYGNIEDPEHEALLHILDNTPQKWTIDIKEVILDNTPQKWTIDIKEVYPIRAETTNLCLSYSSNLLHVRSISVLSLPIRAVELHTMVNFSGKLDVLSPPWICNYGTNIHLLPPKICSSKNFIKLFDRSTVLKLWTFKYKYNYTY